MDCAPSSIAAALTLADRSYPRCWGGPSPADDVPVIDQAIDEQRRIKVVLRQLALERVTA